MYLSSFFSAIAGEHQSDEAVESGDDVQLQIPSDDSSSQNSDQEIADQMYVASTTVRNVLSRIYKKLDIEGRNRLSAMVWQDRPDGSALD